MIRLIDVFPRLVLLFLVLLVLVGNQGLSGRAGAAAGDESRPVCHLACKHTQTQDKRGSNAPCTSLDKHSAHPRELHHPFNEASLLRILQPILNMHGK